MASAPNVHITIRTHSVKDKPVKMFLKRLLYGLTHNVNVKRAVRTAAVTFLTIFVPGLIGWLHALTAWAPGAPFPDLHPLGALAVAAVLAAAAGLVNLVINALETATGKGFLRPVMPTRVTDAVVDHKALDRMLRRP